jgi:hypothetical protein
MAFIHFMVTVVGGSAVATGLLAGAVKVLHVVQTKASISTAGKALLR